MKKILEILFNIKSDDNKSKDVKTEETENTTKTEIADFEEAITATGFGKFNVLLIILAIPSGWSSMFESTTSSYVIPVAHCDLDMSLEEKGYLISITYLGMLTSALIWGFLSDTLGRKKLLVIGFLSNAFFNFLGAISQNYAMIMFSKYMGGFIINGPFAVLMAALSEFHSAKYRSRVVLSMGIIFSTANIVLPLLSLALLTKEINLSFFNGKFVIHSWHIFLLVCTLPSLISGIGHIFLPESPKFLMTAGRNEEALNVFRKVYSLNTGNPPEDYPIKKLLEETTQFKKSTAVAFVDGFAQIRPLFHKPHLFKIILVCTCQVGCLMGLNTLRLWMPQILTAINDYHATHNNEDSDMCNMLEMVKLNATLFDEDADCFVNYDSYSVYTNSMIIAGVSIVGYTFVGSLVNIVGKKRFMVSLLVSAGIFGFSLYFAKDSAAAIALSSIFIAFAGISTNVALSIIVDLFPTTLRTMALAITLMCGRAGAMTGNSIFPHLINSGCLPPFLFIGLSTISCGLLALLIPNTEMKPLE